MKTRPSNIVIPQRLKKRVLMKVKKNPDTYESLSHFIRIAIIRELKK